MRLSLAIAGLVGTFVFVMYPCAAQTPTQAAAKDYSFVVTTPTQAWTDTGLDLGAGEVMQISTTDVAPCTSAQSDQTAQKENLPLPSVPAGAAIFRLHAQAATPSSVGANTQVSIDEPAHLYLSANGGNCAGSLKIKVHVTPATPKTAAATSSADQTTASRGDVLKKQLANAADIFLAGQFGTGAATTTAASGAAPATAPASSLKVSDAPLDSTLRKNIDGLPRRVNDQFKNLGDMVNFVIVGSEQQAQSALDAANWHVADTDNRKAVLDAAMETYEKKDYLAMPMSILYLFGRRQDFGYEQADPIAMVASRHHFRIWKAPFTWNGQTVWAGAGTHDIGFAKDQRNGSITHKIDPSVDGERDNIGSSLQKAGKAKTLTYYLPPNPVQEAKNATGDGYHSDGRILVIMLQ